MSSSRKPTSTKNSEFSLSRIHRLIRPLKAAINSLQQSVATAAITHSNAGTTTGRSQQKKHQFYSEPKHNKSAIQEGLEYRQTITKKKYSRAPTRPRNTNPISSPIFNNQPKHPSRSFSNQLNPPTTAFNNLFNLIHSQQNNQSDWEIQIKIDKIIFAYKNILDHTTIPIPTLNNQKHLNQHTDKLTSICARVIGNFIEHAINLESNPNHTTHQLHPDQTNLAIEDGPNDSQIQPAQPTSLFAELDWKTSVMDEWYDAIPLLYRRYALAQHALKMILLGFPRQRNNPKQTRRTNTANRPMKCPQTLFQALHCLHRTYNSPTIQSQALLLLPSLFSLPTQMWFGIYDDYVHKFDLGERFMSEFHLIAHDLSFLEFCNDRELIGFIDLTIHHFGSWIIEKWLNQRESLIKSRMIWRSTQESLQAGLESPEPEDLDPGMTEEVITEYDKQTSSILINWIQSLVMNCVPNSVNCKSARIELNAISRLIFDSLTSFKEDVCSKSDNYFLSLICITIESHRLALFGLPMFNTGSVDDPVDDAQWSSPHTPMRLQALIPQTVTSLDHKIFNKAAKLFFRAHRSTRLLAILPGLLSTRHQPIIPGLDQLLEFVIKRDYSIEFVAKSWVESLLKSDPKSWWLDADSNRTSVLSTASEEEEEVRSRGAQDVRAWLENWLSVLDEAEKLRESLSDHEQSDNQQSDDDEEQTSSLNPLIYVADQPAEDPDDVKPQVTCSCPPIKHEEVTAAVHEEDPEKPDVVHGSTDPAEHQGKKVTKQPSSHQIKVVVPSNRKRRRKSSFLTLPSSRSKRRKSMTPCLKARLRPAGPPTSSWTMVRRHQPTCAAVGDSDRRSRARRPAPRRPSAQAVQSEEEEEEEEEDGFDAMDLLVAGRRNTPSSTAPVSAAPTNTTANTVTTAARAAPAAAPTRRPSGRAAKPALSASLTRRKN